MLKYTMERRAVALKTKFFKKDHTVAIVSVLILSIILNIYSSYKISSYKYKLGQQSYNYIEEIRQRNEGNMDILSKSLKDGNIKNEELLKLYKNYDVIAGNIIGLWQRYASYSQDKLSFFTKTIDTDKVIENDIHGQIKEYVFSILNNEMKNEENKLVLIDEDKLCFEAMYDMSEKIYNYFNDFNDNVLQGSIGEEKESKVVKEHYWIDMLEGIYDINADYVNIQWKIKVNDI